MTAIEALPDQQQLALRMLVEQEKDYADVAAHLGVSDEDARELAHTAARTLGGEEELPIGVIDRLLCQRPADPETVTALRAHEPAAQRLAKALEPLSERPWLAYLRDMSPAAARVVPFALVTTIMVSGITAGIVVGLTHH